MVDRRGKRTKIWDSWYYSAHIKVTFDARILEFGLGPFGAKFPVLQFLKLCSSPDIHPVSSKLYTTYPNHGAIVYRLLPFFLAICRKKI